MLFLCPKYSPFHFFTFKILLKHYLFKENLWFLHTRNYFNWKGETGERSNYRFSESKVYITPILLCIYLFHRVVSTLTWVVIGFFVCFYSTRGWTQGLSLARQMFYLPEPQPQGIVIVHICLIPSVEAYIFQTIRHHVIQPPHSKMSLETRDCTTSVKWELWYILQCPLRSQTAWYVLWPLH
jgi:hypothetical protein